MKKTTHPVFDNGNANMLKNFFDNFNKRAKIKKELDKLLEKKFITNCNEFMKILIACGVSYNLLDNYDWTIEELSTHKYHCIGVHPVAKRIDIIKENIILY